MTEKKEKVYVFLNKAFVKTDLKNKEGKSFNIATLPKGTQIGGQTLSGYVFYPLYVNPSKYNDNVFQIPYLSDAQVQLHKNGKTITVSPEELKEGLNQSYKEWKKTLAQEADNPNIAQEAEFEWQKYSFEEYIHNYTNLSLDRLKGESCLGKALSQELIGYEVREGNIITAAAERNAFFKKYFDEAGNTHQWLKEIQELRQPDINIFDDPEQFYLSMMERGIEGKLASSKYLQEHEEDMITMDEEMIELLKTELGLSEMVGESMVTREKELNEEIEL